MKTPQRTEQPEVMSTNYTQHLKSAAARTGTTTRSSPPRAVVVTPRAARHVLPHEMQRTERVGPPAPETQSSPCPLLVVPPFKDRQRDAASCTNAASSPSSSTATPVVHDALRLKDLLRGNADGIIDWKAVVRRAQSHARELSYHSLKQVLLLNPPWNALEAMIRSKAWLVLPSSHHETPIGYLVCTSKDVLPEVFGTFLRVTVSLYGIKKAMEVLDLSRPNVSLEKLEIALRQHPECLMQSSTRHTPSALEGVTMLGRIVLADITAPCYWEKLNLVLRTASFHKSSDERAKSKDQSFLVLHSFLEFLCQVGPFNGNDYFGSTVSRHFRVDSSSLLRILELIQDKVPEQFRMPDSNGSLPLHIAVRSWGMAAGMLDPKVVIEFLLKECPESAGISDGERRLALHSAVSAGNACYDLVAAADPGALTIPCPVTGFYPFQLASEKECALLPVDAVYSLLRECPQLLREVACAYD